ncbi:amidohydrolase family protein [uncultured Aliiroseovarius sp.]|uniref:amidohydrolase family protein n=1 Tax=uncultured Aliiroseovarius sp. TaxID=1658783 RepID=UPI002592D8F8|nr:amidohydrolase family protein [uncultured Aliiroseovarius sp.]
MSNLFLRNVRPWGDETVDLVIRNGRIAQIGAGLDAGDLPQEDGGNALLVPGLIDCHTHLDKTTWGMDWFENTENATLQGRIDYERDNRIDLGIDPDRQSMRHALHLARNGATHIRSHVDIDTEHGLAIFDGVMRTREKLADVIEIEIVAFPQSGLVKRPGTAELLDEALSNGAAVVGGIDPCGMDRDPKGQLDTVFDLAERHGAAIDIHLHETGELGGFDMDEILSRTAALGMQGKVTISHAFALGSLPEARTRTLIERIAELDVAIATTGSPNAMVPRLLELKEAGIRVGAGCDGIRDTWGPWGKPDMLHRAEVLGMRNGFRRDQDLAYALEVCSTGGARVMQREGHDLSIGSQADFCLIDAMTPAHAVAATAPRRMTIKSGRVVVRDGTFTQKDVVMP